MENIRIEEIGNINLKYRNLEVFYKSNIEYFLFIGISDDRQLFFEIPSHKKDVTLSVEEWGHILNIAKSFLPKALADEDFYDNEWDK